MQKCRVPEVKKTVFCSLIVILCALILSGCGKQTAGKSRAEQIITKVFTASNSQQKTFKSILSDIDITDESGIVEIKGMSEFFKDEYADYLTEKCIERMMSNRYFAVGNPSLSEIETDIVPKNVKVTQVKSDAVEYSYSAELWSDDKNIATVKGSILFSNTEPQKADSVTVKLTAK